MISNVQRLDGTGSEHHDAYMRTTLTLDPDVVRLVEDEIHRMRRPFKHVVNDALRRGLAPRAQPPAGRRYRVRPHKTSVQAGIDEAGFNRLADEMEDEAVLAKLGRR